MTTETTTTTTTTKKSIKLSYVNDWCINYVPWRNTQCCHTHTRTHTCSHLLISSKTHRITSTLKMHALNGKWTLAISHFSYWETSFGANVTSQTWHSFVLNQKFSINKTERSKIKSVCVRARESNNKRTTWLKVVCSWQAAAFAQKPLQN